MSFRGLKRSWRRCRIITRARPHVGIFFKLLRMGNERGGCTLALAERFVSKSQELIGRVIGAIEEALNANKIVVRDCEQ